MALGGMALVFGLGLSYADKKFKTDEDPRLRELIDTLPSVNCGGCGYPGCANFAQALLSNEAKPEDCPVGGNNTIQAVGALLGIEVKELVRQSAFIRCAGGESNSSFRYKYYGLHSCSAIMQLAAGGSKSCDYGCLGGGSCKAACDFDAVVMKDGIAKIDKNKCTACGMCVPACPRGLIVMVPHKSSVRVACNSHDEAKVVRAGCKVGCINCRICEKVCGFAAIKSYNLLAEVDYERCTECGLCVTKCPTKCIVD